MSSPYSDPPSEAAPGGGSDWMLARAFEHLPAAIWTLDRDLRFTSLRGDLLRDLGADPEALVGTPILDLLTDAQADRDIPEANRRVLEGETQQLKVRWRGHTWQVLLEPIRPEAGTLSVGSSADLWDGGADWGRVEGVLGVALDISAQEDTARRLEEERAHLRELFEQAPGAVVLLDEEDRILDVNRDFERLFGYRRSETIGYQINALITPPGREAEASALSQSVLGGDRVDAEAVRRRKDGSEVHVAIHGSPVDLDSKRTTYGIYRDITRQKELEAQLLHSQRLEAVGQLAGGVAHDFNNALTVILGQVEALRERIDDPETQGELTHLETSAKHAGRLIQGLLTFSRRDVVTPEEVDLNEVIRETVALLGSSLEEQVEVGMELDHTAPPVEADPNQLRQMLMNLVLNARDAMPEGGAIVLRTRARGEGEEHGPGAPMGGGGVVLEVADTGHGMTLEEISRIFEPYYTTKPPGKGSGLGLSVVYGIVERAGGSMDVASEPGDGTTFRVAFPGVGEAARAEAAAGEARGRILLVDDEGPVLRAARRILEDAGHRVLTASSGADALRLRGMEEPPDLALVDLAMPDINGVELMEELQSHWPGLHVVFTTGYTEGEWSQKLEQARNLGHEFIPKPFDAQTLTRKVREVLVRG